MNEKPKRRSLMLVRKVRPRYNKLLIPALIISFIIAVILILIVRKYLLEPLLENQGRLGQSQSVVIVQTGNPSAQEHPTWCAAHRG
jgi:hypothetical protein